ncbi:MAG: hypothetical protein ACXIVG_11485 [Pararhodobacter sp.]
MTSATLTGRTGRALRTPPPVRRRLLGAALALVLAPVGLGASAQSPEIGENPFRYLSDLAAEGFTPFPVSNAGNASFGMMQDADLYLCFIADNLSAQGRRQSTLLAEINGNNPDPVVPNIPVLCILTQ